MIAVGLARLWRHDTAQGTVGVAPTKWPSEAAVELSTDTSTLIMAAHPHCPCTRASVNELARVMAEAGGKIRAYVLVLQPANAEPTWSDTGLERTAAAIPGVSVIKDIDGKQAERFGAETSGHTLLFDATGRLLFSGGITASRGHEGDNIGEDSIVALANGAAAAASRTRVFGCSLAEVAGKVAATP